MADISGRHISRYSVVESNNITLGQSGVAFLSDNDKYTPPSGFKVIAIQFTEDTVFDSGNDTTANADWPTVNQGGPGTNSSVISTATMPQGMTIYGRWDTVGLDSGSAFLYLGPA